MLRVNQKQFDEICGAIEIALTSGATDTMGVSVRVARTRYEVEAAVKGALVTLNRGEPVMTNLEQELCGFMSKDGKVAFSIPPEEVMRHELEERREDARRSRVVSA